MPFFVDAGERAGGRHTVAHEFPFSRSPAYVEDLGLRARTFNVEGYVVGSEYEAAKLRLLDALEVEGPGELVHPYLGSRRVAVSTYRVRETRNDGGTATFTIEFIETVTDAPAPVAVPSVQSAVAKISAAKLAAANAFLARAPSAVIGADLSPVSAQVGAAMTGRMRAALLSLPLAPAALATFTRLVSPLEIIRFAQRRFPTPAFETLTESVYLVAELERVFDGFIAIVEQVVTSPLNPVSLVLGVGSGDFGLRPLATTPTRAAERVMFDELTVLVRRLAITGAASLLLRRTFSSYEDAITAREDVLDAIDRATEAATDDAFPAFNDLYSALVDSVPGPQSDLPRLQSYTPPAVTPSLVIAQRVYGAVTRETELVARNKVRHPGFVPPEPLEVLVDG